METVDIAGTTSEGKSLHRSPGAVDNLLPGLGRDCLGTEHGGIGRGKVLLWAGAQRRRRINVLEIDAEGLAENLDLELEVELELGKMVELDEQAEDRHQPRVRGLEDPGARGLLEDLADEGDGHNQAVLLEPFDKKVLERDVAMADRPVFGQRERSEPGSEVLQRRSLAPRRDSLFGVEDGGAADEGLVEDLLDHRQQVERVDELHVEAVVVGLDADPLRDEVPRKPSKVLRLDRGAHVGDLGIKVARGKVVDDEQDPVRNFLVGLGRLGLGAVGTDRGEGRTFIGLGPVEEVGRFGAADSLRVGAGDDCAGP